MRTNTDREMIVTLDWLQRTLLAREEPNLGPVLFHLREAEKALRAQVDVPRVTQREPAVVTRMRECL